MGINIIENYDIASETDESVEVWDIEYDYVDGPCSFDITTESDDESNTSSDVSVMCEDMVKGCLIKCVRCKCKKDASHYGVKGNGDRLKTCVRCVEYMKEYVKK